MGLRFCRKGFGVVKLQLMTYFNICIRVLLVGKDSNSGFLFLSTKFRRKKNLKTRIHPLNVGVLTVSKKKKKCWCPHCDFVFINLAVHVCPLFEAN